MREKLIEILGGFATVEQAIDSIKSEEEKHKILTRAVAKLFNTITEDDILKKNSKGQYTFQGKPLLEAEVVALKAQADDLMQSRLFNVLDKELHYIASKKVFFEAQNVRDIVDGKLIEYTWHIIKSKLKKL